MRETKSKSVFGIFIVTIFFVAIGFPVVSSAGQEDSRILEITIEDSETAAVEWRIPYPGEDSVYLQVAYQILQENIADVEVGLEQLFLQDVRDIQIAEDNETLVITFNLAGNYSDGFITGKYKDLRELGEYAPVGIDVLKINIPENKYLSSISPGPNEIIGNELTYYDFNWIYPLEIYYSDQLTTAQIGEEWKLPTIKTISVEDLSAEKQGEIGILATPPTPIPNSDFGINNYSKYLIPGYEMYVGGVTVPGTGGKTAYEIADDYKPELYKGKSTVLPPGPGPDYGYYRVLKGYDPYTGFDAYLIQYIMYWDYQICAGKSHKHDFEPIFIWVKNIGEKPYRVAYDRWRLDAMHIYGIHRTDLWTEDPPIPDGRYDLDDMDPVYTQDKSYYPIGRHRYLADQFDDLLLHNLTTSLTDSYWNGNHVKLNHANCYNTFDYYIDIGEERGEQEFYPLAPLNDTHLKTWYRIFKDDPAIGLVTVGNFTIDVSDPFYGVFWDGVGPEPYPKSIDITLNTATPDDGVLTVDASVSYDHDNYPSPRPLKGLHDDRFEGYFGSTLLSLSSITEKSAGRYELNFDISSFAIGETYTFKLKVNDNLDILSYTVTDSVDIPGDTTPPTSPDLIYPSGTIGDTTPTFNWTESTDDLTGIHHYQIQVDTKIDFSSPVIDKTRGPAYTYYTAPSGVLSSGVTYYWHVWAVDNSGNRGGNSTTWSFVIDTSCQDTAGPDTPSISSPSDGATITVETYTVNWGDVTDNGCADMGGYEVKEAKSGGSTKTYPTDLTSEYDFSKSRSENGDYTYRVRGVDAFGNKGDWSGAVSITGEFE